MKLGLSWEGQWLFLGFAYLNLACFFVANLYLQKYVGAFSHVMTLSIQWRYRSDDGAFQYALLALSRGRVQALSLGEVEGVVSTHV